jgi:hypothetical protein
MHDEWQPPPVPNVREDAGGDWHDLWRRAHLEMRPYGRRPSRHLIDMLLEDDRRWLQESLGAIALATLSGMSDDQNPTRRATERWLWLPATMKQARVRIVLEADEILTAYPTGVTRRHR